MKNIFKSLMFVAVAAMTFTACTQENNEVNAVKKGTTLTITADLAADDTRVAFGEADANGVRKTLWEAGDKVSFVVYRSDAIYTFVNDLEVAEAGATANFTVEFPETLQAGDRIEALVGQYVYDYYGYYYYLNTHEYSQNPTDDGLSTVYVKAVAEYDGNDVVSLTFKHQYPYGKMTTDFAVKFTSVDFEFFGVNADGNEAAAYASIYPQNITGNDYWFYATNELFDITEITINAEGADNKSYKFTKEIEASVGFKFVVGEISSFTVNDFGLVLVAPEVEAVADATSVKLTWDAVEGAKDYTVTFNGEDTVVTVCEFTATGLNSFTNYSFSVAPNPDDSGKYYQDDSSSSYVSVTTLPDESIVADFSYVYDVKEVREGYTYAYKFSNSSNAEEYIYLQFEEDVFSLPAGTYTYTTNDGLVYGGVSAFNIPEYANGSYKEHWMQDSHMVVVEVAEYITITAYCTRFINGGYNDNATYKGVWSNKPAESEPTQTQLAQPTDLVATATADTATITWTAVENASSYDVTVGTTTQNVANPATTATFEGLDPDTTYNVSVVAVGDGTNYTNSTAATTTVTTLAASTGGDDVVEDYTNWDYKAEWDTSSGLVTLTGNQDGRVITLVTNDVVITKFYGDTSKVDHFTDVKVNGVSATATAESWFMTARVGGVYNAEIDMTIDGVHYSGVASSFSF